MSTAPTPSNRPLPRRRRRLWLSFAAILVAAFALPFAWHLWDEADAERELADTLTDLDGAEPGWREATDFALTQPLPAELVRKLIARPDGLASLTMAHFDRFGKAKARPGVLMSAADREAMRQGLAHQAAFIEEVIRALRSADNASPTDALSAATVDLQWTNRVRDLANRLHMAACLEGQSEQSEALQPILEASWALPRTLWVFQNPLFQFLIRDGSFRPAFLDCFEHLLTIHAFSPEELASWQARFLAEADQADALLTGAAAAERAAFRRWAESMANKPDEFKRSVKETYGWGRTSAWRIKIKWLDDLLQDWLNRPPLRPMPAEFAGYLRYQTDVLTILRKPMPLKDRKAELAKLDAAINERPLYTRLMHHPYGKCVETTLRCQADLRAMALLVAGERFRLEKGRWPEHAQELTPDLLKQVPIDPYTEKTMAFTKDAQGLLVTITGPATGPKTHRLWSPELRRRPAEEGGK